MAEDQVSGSSMTIGAVARLLMLSEERVRQLVKLEIIPKEAKGVYSPVKVVQGYIKFLKDEERRNSKSATVTRMQEAKAQEIEMRVAESQRRLVPVEDASAAIDLIMAKVRAEIAGIPARATRDLELRRRLEAEVHGTLNRIAEAIVASAEFIETGGDLPSGSGSDDA